MDILNADLIAEHTNESGEVDYQAINEQLSANLVNKEEAQKRLNDTVAKEKGKYQRKLEELTKNTSGNGEEDEQEQPQAVTMSPEQLAEYVQNQLDTKLSAREQEAKKAQELDSLLSEKVEDKYKDFVKFQMNQNKDFDMDEFIKENPYLEKKGSTRSDTNFGGTPNPTAGMSDKQKRIYELANQKY